MTGNQIPNNKRFEDLRGLRFSRLVVMDFVRIYKKHPEWICECDCGNKVKVRSQSLKRGKVRSCKCFQMERRSEAHRTHGETKGRSPTPEYRVWLAMKARCTNPKDKNFARYGGRGIAICDRWLDGEDGKGGYECFLADMGRRQSLEYQIDRIDNEQGYSPENCRWATPTQQQRNRRDTIRVVLAGETLALADACDKVGVRYMMVRDRVYRGWTFERAITEPVHNNHGRG